MHQWSSKTGDRLFSGQIGSAARVTEQIVIYVLVVPVKGELQDILCMEFNDLLWLQIMGLYSRETNKYSPHDHLLIGRPYVTFIQGCSFVSIVSCYKIAY